jgi:hypothetical protein
MKIIFICFYIIAFLGSNNFLCAQEIAKGEELYQKITIETLYPCFKALKNGDVSSIKLHISEGMYERYKVLLEKNKDYPEFLRNYYRGVDFGVEKVELSGQEVSVAVSIQFPDNESLNSKFLLRKRMNELNSDETGGRWKIVKQLSE